MTQKIDRNDPYFIPYVKGYGMIDDYYVDWMGNDHTWEPLSLVRGNLHIMKDFIPITQTRWYDENKLLYTYKINENSKY